MFGSDLKYALRSLARQKLATSLVIGMLALGIGANIVVFSLVNGIYLRPFPFPQPDRLVSFNETAPKWNLEVVGINYPDFHRWRQDARMFEAMAQYETATFTISDDRGAERVSGLRVTSDFAAVLGIRPVLGRMFTADEDRPKGPDLVLIGQSVWRDRFERDPNVIGKMIRLNSAPHTIVGVLPAEAEFPGEVRMWVARKGDPNADGGSYGGDGIGRLKPGVTVEDADRDLQRAHQPIWDAHDKEKVVSPFVRSLRDVFTEGFKTIASTLLAAVAVLLLVACANVASVMLARAIARRREIGIRLAMGASGLRLVRQLLVENLVLSLFGGALGLVLGYSALTALIASAGDNVPRWASFSLDARVVGFSVGLSAVTAILFGWAPAIHAVRGTAGAIHAGRTTEPHAGRATLSMLVAAEFAMAAGLLVCGGLLLRAYDRVRHVDPGFTTDHVLTALVALPRSTYPNEAAQVVFWNRLLERAAALPGVSAAGLVSCAPFGCHTGTFYVAEGAPAPAPGQSNPVVLYRPASDDYPRAMGLTLKSGRWFDTRDAAADAPTVAVVNETFANTFWPGGADPVGRRIRGAGASANAPWRTVIGVMRDVKHYGLERPMRPGLYLPLAKSPRDGMTIALRTTVEPQSLAATLRALVRELNPDLALYQVRTMEEAIGRSLVQRAVYSWMLVVFAGLALVLALGGTYGVTSYLVSQRTRELGIRVALGAVTKDIVRAVLRPSLVVVGVGLVVGVAGAVAAARLMSTLLFGVPPYDVMILTIATALLALTALSANWLPARRAARVDPMTSLRVE